MRLGMVIECKTKSWSESRNYFYKSLFKFSNEKRPRTIVSWFRLGFSFASRWPFRVSSSTERAVPRILSYPPEKLIFQFPLHSGLEGGVVRGLQTLIINLVTNYFTQQASSYDLYVILIERRKNEAQNTKRPKTKAGQRMWERAEERFVREVPPEKLSFQFSTNSDYMSLLGYRAI